LVLGLQVEQAPLKGLAAGTRDGSDTCIIGKANSQLHGLQLLSRDQLELDALNKYDRFNQMKHEARKAGTLVVVPDLLHPPFLQEHADGWS
jgi:hypothetical protein